MEEQAAKVMVIAFLVNKKSTKLRFDAFFRMANSLLLNFLSRHKKSNNVSHHQFCYYCKLQW